MAEAFIADLVRFEHHALEGDVAVAVDAKDSR